MSTKRMVRGLLLLVAVLLAGGTLAPSAVADDSKLHATWGPPKPPPPEWGKGGQAAGVDQAGNWCILGEADGCEFTNANKPNVIAPCDANGQASDTCSKEDQQAFEQRALEDWRKKADHNAKNFPDLDAYISKCVDKGKPFKFCWEQGLQKYPEPGSTPVDWFKEKVAELAADAFGKLASYIGRGVVWFLQTFAREFAAMSTINLAQTGIGKVLSITTALSAVTAIFVLMIQLGKAAVSMQGGPLATGAMGLLKYGAILSVYVTGTQTALYWSDQLSLSLITLSFNSGGADPAGVLEQRLGTMFAGLVGTGSTAAVGGALVTGSGVAANAVAFVVIVGVLAVIAICALWLEMLMRQAGIMILVATMPISLSGQLADPTSSWWPRSRDALIALILTKPVITMCFAIGFTTMTDAEGVRNVIVGLVIFLTAGFAWPVVATYMTFTTNGAGKSLASGAVESIGSSLSSLHGSQLRTPSGPGAAGGGAAYSRALEGDGATSAPSADGPAGGGGFWSNDSLTSRLKGSTGGSFGSKVAGPLALGLQLASAGKSVLEGGMANTAAHAGLGPSERTGAHVIPPRGHSPAAPPAQGDGGSKGTEQPSGEPPALTIPTPSPSSGPLPTVAERAPEGGPPLPATPGAAPTLPRPPKEG
ncbi:hypothetical protein ACFYUJ_39110 [Streptomyces sp. NPDC004520]|uniref:hypothetical protein n=1 Tax=Streptomyces sp. NPDC004520 TaxID=3364702 RepID=UPI00368BF39B